MVQLQLVTVLVESHYSRHSMETMRTRIDVMDFFGLERTQEVLQFVLFTCNDFFLRHRYKIKFELNPSIIKTNKRSLKLERSSIRAEDWFFADIRNFRILMVL